MPNVLHEAAAVIRSANLNVTIEFVLDEQGDTLYNLRATHWRGSEHDNRMYLVCERTLDDALVLLSNAVYQRLYVVTDWRKRLYTTGVSGFRSALAGHVENPGNEARLPHLLPRTQSDENTTHDTYEPYKSS